MIFLKLVTNEFNNESRDKRELSVVNSFNIDVVVMAKGKFNEVSYEDGYVLHKRTTRPLGNYNLIVQLNRLCCIFTWASYARRLNAYCISCHDLLALFIGWISTWFMPKDKRPLLVYDSHEFEVGRNTDGRRSKLEGYIVQRLERFLMNRCVFSIMVNDSIADEVQRIHGLKTRPIVVRNIPEYWKIDEDICKRRRLELFKQLDIFSDTFLIMYHGAVTAGRGIEVLLQAVCNYKDVVFIILGNGEEEYIDKLKQTVVELKVSERVLFHEAVATDILWEYIGAADVGMITIPAVSKSYYYMLPNKFFENIQALTPIIGSNFPEIKRIVKNYNIGSLVDPDSVEEIIDAIEEMRTNKEMYHKYKMNLLLAKKELCWENESKVLKEAYKEILM